MKTYQLIDIELDYGLEDAFVGWGRLNGAPEKYSRFQKDGELLVRRYRPDDGDRYLLTQEQDGEIVDWLMLGHKPGHDAIAGNFKAELERTADLLVEIAEEQGVYFAIALLHDSGYSREAIKQLLEVLRKTPGAVKQGGAIAADSGVGEL